MRKALLKSLVPALPMIIFLLSGSSVLAATVATQNSSLFPEWILNIFAQIGFNGICTAQYINSRSRLAFFLVMGALVLVSVIYIIIAAFKYITSQGETEKVKKANKAIFGIFMGIAVMIIGILGMVMVFVFLGVKPTAPIFFQTCISAIGSQGCQDCMNDQNSTLCLQCETAYNNACNNSTPAPDINSQLDQAGLSYCYR